MNYLSIEVISDGHFKVRGKCENDAELESMICRLVKDVGKNINQADAEGWETKRLGTEWINLYPTCAKEV